MFARQDDEDMCLFYVTLSSSELSCLRDLAEKKEQHSRDELEDILIDKLGD